MKNAIKKAFSRAFETYDNYADVQSESSNHLVKLVFSHAKREFQSILDISCGTGITTLALMKKYPNSTYTLTDISENMIQKAKEKLKCTNYIVCDAEQSIFEKHDLSISNLSIQWFDDIEAFIQKMSKTCNIFAFSTLLDSSFREYKNIFQECKVCPPTFSYHHYDSLLSICNKYGKLSIYDSKIYVKRFKCATDIAKYFKGLGANISSRKDANISLIIKNYNSPISLNYDVFFAVMKFM